MTKDQFFLDLIKAVLPAIISRQIPTPVGAARSAVEYAQAVMERPEVLLCLTDDAAAGRPQAADPDVYTLPVPVPEFSAPKAKPGTNKRG